MQPANISFAAAKVLVGKDRACVEARESVLADSTLVAVVETASGTDASGVLEQLEQEYVARKADSAFDALVKAVESVSGRGSRATGLVAAVLQRGLVYLCTYGEGTVVLWRNARLVALLKGNKGGVKSASGFVQRGDKFVIATTPLFTKESRAPLTECLQEATSAQGVVDWLAQYFGNELAAAFFLEAQAGPVQSRQKNLFDKAGLPSFPSFLFLQGLQNKGGAFIKNALRRVAFKLPRKEVEIKRDEVSSRRRAVVLGAILLALLLVSVLLGVSQKSAREYRSTYEGRLVQAQRAYEDSLLQKEVDPGRSRELFLQSEVIVEGLLTEGVKDKELTELKEEIEANRTQILGRVEAAPTSFVDLSLIRSGVLAKEMVIHGERVAVLDEAGGRIISFDLSGKNATVVGGSSLKSPTVIALYDDRYFALGSSGVFELEKGDAKRVISRDKEWGEIAKLGAFGGNLYLLDKDGEIWRYPGVEGGFGARQGWLGSGVSPDFSQSVDMAIDGSIWVLSGNGRINKFTRGAPDAFVEKGLDQGLADSVAIYTDENLDALYVLDSGGRIVEIAKDGEYQKQYLLKDVSGVKDLVVSETEGKIFLLLSEKVLELNLER